MRLGASGVVLCLLVAGAVHAQEAQPSPLPKAQPASAHEAQPTLSAPPIVAPTPGPTPAPDAPLYTAETLYDEAFAALAAGDAPLSARRLQQLLLEFPEHPLAAKARRLLDQIAVPSTRVPDDATASRWNANTSVARDFEESEAPRDPHRPTTAARAELIFFQTLHGVALGLEVCAMAECEAAEPWVGTMMLGGGAGFAASYLLSRDGVSPGLARALTNGTIWGAAHGIEVFIGTEMEQGVDEEIRLGASLGLGQLGGVGVAALLYNALHPTAGQVSLASSGGIWASVITGEMLGIIQPDEANGGVAWLFMATGDLGLIAGGLLGAHQPMSASRVLMIDAGGVLGSLVGLGLGVLVAPDDEFGDQDLGVTFGVGLIGTLAGLGSAYYFTNEWDGAGSDAAQSTTPQLALVPSQDGATLSIHGQW